MKKYSRKLAALAAAASLALTGTLAGCSSANNDHKIRIGIKFDQPGLGYQDGSQYTGFDVDVARYIAGKLGYSEDQIEFVESPSANRENMLNNGQVDMIFATYSISDSRKKTVDCVVALNGGVVDAVTTDDIILAGLAATKANKGKLKVVGAPFTTERYGVGLPKGTDKCEAVNKAINEMVADGTWERLVTKYTEGTGYHYNTEKNPPSPSASCA